MTQNSKDKQIPNSLKKKSHDFNTLHMIMWDLTHSFYGNQNKVERITYLSNTSLKLVRQYLMYSQKQGTLYLMHFFFTLANVHMEVAILGQNFIRIALNFWMRTWFPAHRLLVNFKVRSHMHAMNCMKKGLPPILGMLGNTSISTSVLYPLPFLLPGKIQSHHTKDRCLPNLQETLFVQGRFSFSLFPCHCTGLLLSCFTELSWLGHRLGTVGKLWQETEVLHGRSVLSDLGFSTLEAELSECLFGLAF